MTQLSVDPAKCEGGPGLSYQTGVDYLLFQNYAPWPEDHLTDRVTFDSQGQLNGWRQCPYSLSSAQLEALRTVAQEALAQATTDAERRTFARIDQLLATTNGAALLSGQYGCNDETALANQRRGVSETVDTWWNTSTATVPCDDMPAGAVTTVPPPFDQYLKLVCTRSGQALTPVDGFQWVFTTGYVRGVLSRGQSPAPSDHFVRLTSDLLSEEQVASLRSQLTNSIRFQRLNSGASEPSALERTIIRLSLQTSSGGRRQVYLFVPPQGASRDAHVLGMDCTNAQCDPIYMNSQFFTVTPSS